MVDKMMRMAGRGADGLAKAIRTDDSGNLIITSNDENRQEINLSLNYDGKQKGDITKVLSRAETKIHSNTSLPLSDGHEFPNIDYERVAVEDGTSKILNHSVSGLYVMNVYRFNLLGQLKKEGLLPSNITAENLNEYVNQMNLKVVAFGSSSSLSGLTIKVHRREPTGSFWDVLQETTNSTLEEFNNQVNTSYIDEDGFVIILLHANGAGDGSVHSRLEVDYIELDVSIGIPIMQTRSLKLEEKADEIIKAMQSGGSNIDFVDTDNNTASVLSVERDPSGQAVLRVIDAAPHGYDNLTGSHKTVEQISVKTHDETRSLPLASGSKDIVKITPPLNTVCTIKAIGFNSAVPTGATSGSTNFYVSIGEESPSHYKKPINKTPDFKSTNSIFLSDNEIQQSVRGLQFSESNPLYLVFRNNTDVEITTWRSFYVLHEERVVR